MQERSPCGPTSVLTTHTICQAVQSSSSELVEVVIPYMDNTNQAPCTAVFKWPDMTWHRMSSDRRKTYVGGALASFNRNTRLIHLGGFGEDGKPSKLIHEYEGVTRGWRLWHREAPMSIANATFTPVGIEFCQHSIDLKQMTELDPDGELEPGKAPDKTNLFF